MALRLERAVSPVTGMVTLVLVDEDTYSVHSAARDYAMNLRAAGRSPNTAKAYLPRICRFLNWADERGLDWRTIGLADMARFKIEVEQTPTPRGRPKSGKTVNATLTAVCEFLRFSAAHGHADSQVAVRLSEPKFLRYIPAGFNPGETNQFRTIQARVLKAPEIENAPQTIAPDDEASLLEHGRTARDRFLLAVLFGAALRIGEALGLRRGDLHMLPESSHLGCSTRGAHLHVVPRRDNINSARAKSARSRTVPVPASVVGRYRDYLIERETVPSGQACDYVFINIFGPYAARPMSYSNAKQIIERVGESGGFRARPHMMRHTTATRWIRGGIPVDVVQTLLGHASQTSTAVYVHASDEDMRAAIDNVEVASR
ncbi:tyrosine-type recombinase/integrase [Arthrobacter pigmenti]